MELKFFISGVPNGESLWGQQSDANYFGTLYVPSKESRKFDIRLNKSGNKIYAYYHYLVYNTINDVEGRTGSYIGLTIRIDSFCTDFKTIYNVLDIVYRKKILGFILKSVNGGRLQYVYHSFDKINVELSELEKYIRNVIGTSLVTSDFKNIPSLPTGRGNMKLNWEDASINNVTQIVGQYGFCSISDEYTSRAVDLKLQEEYKRGVQSQQSEIGKLNGTIETLRQNISILQENKRQLSNVGNSYGQNISYNSQNYRNNDDEYGNDNDNSKSSIITYVIGFVLVVTLFILGYFIYTPSANHTEDTNIEQSMENAADSLKQEKDSLHNANEQNYNQGR